MKPIHILFLLCTILSISLFVTQAPGQYAWTKLSSPVLTPSPLGSWYKEVWGADVLYNVDSSRYEMWFSAGLGPELNWLPFQIAFAVSHDGHSWNIVGSGPVLTSIAGTWEANVCNPSVLREGGIYRMWYTAFRALTSADSGYLGYATSVDGITWTRYGANPVLRPGPAAWEFNYVGDVSVIKSAGLYQMFYGGGPLSNWNIGRIGRATSIDGINWTKDTLSNPVLDVGGAGQWDQGRLTLPRVFSIKDTMFICYTCMKSSGGWRAVGLARSTNGGTVWQKYGTGPILSAGPPGSWEETYVQEGLVLPIGDTLQMWYSGFSSSATRASIGHATSPLTMTGLTQRNATVPEEFSLQQNYPNPFNPSTTIKFQLPRSSVVRLSVCDILGREVSVLVNERRDAGVHEVKFDGSNLASGVYFYRLQAGDFVATKKLILLK